MAKFDPQETLLQLFVALRRRNLPLGLRDLLDAVRAAESGMLETADDLGMLLGMLWCHSPEEACEFDLIWQSLEEVTAASRADKKEEQHVAPPATDYVPKQEPVADVPVPASTVASSPTP
jgi:hypothetical protein